MANWHVQSSNQSTLIFLMRNESIPCVILVRVADLQNISFLFTNFFHSYNGKKWHGCLQINGNVVCSKVVLIYEYIHMSRVSHHCILKSVNEFAKVLVVTVWEISENNSRVVIVNPFSTLTLP